MFGCWVLVFGIFVGSFTLLPPAVRVVVMYICGETFSGVHFIRTSTTTAAIRVFVGSGSRMFAVGERKGTRAIVSDLQVHVPVFGERRNNMRFSISGRRSSRVRGKKQDLDDLQPSWRLLSLRSMATLAADQGTLCPTKVTGSPQFTVGAEQNTIFGHANAVRCCRQTRVQFFARPAMKHVVGMRHDDVQRYRRDAVGVAGSTRVLLVFTITSPYKHPRKHAASISLMLI